MVPFRHLRDRAAARPYWYWQPLLVANEPWMRDASANSPTALCKPELRRHASGFVDIAINVATAGSAAERQLDGTDLGV